MKSLFSTFFTPIKIGEENLGIGSQYVNLSMKNLTELPESIGKLTNLKSLNLHNNNLSALPESIGNLTKLERLDLDNNNLSALPESIGNLTKLKYLYLYNNNLSALPESIGNLTKLERLYLHNNNLSALPESIGNLTKLEKLYLHNNNLSALPESIGNLTNLNILSLEHNNLSALPESIGNLINSKMKHLYVGHNKLIHIPNIPNIPLKYFHVLKNVSSNYKTLLTLPFGYIDWHRNNRSQEELYKKFHEEINKGHIYSNNLPSNLINAIKSTRISEEEIIRMIPNSDLSYLDKNDNTALICACAESMHDLALALINTGQSNPGHVNKDGDTALIFATFNEIPDVALALINTGESNPGRVTKDGDTALNYAITNKMHDVALALIYTGESNPGHVSKYGDTALMLACEESMSDVALALIDTNNVDTEIINYTKEDALYFAEENNLTEVITRLSKMPKINFNINTTVFDFLEGTDIPITDSLNEGNIVFVYYDNDIKKSIKVSIPEQRIIGLNDPIELNNYIIYECLKENSMRLINRRIRYFDIKKLTGFSDVIRMNDVNYIIENITNNSDMPKVFIFKKTYKTLLTTVSHEVLFNNGNRSGARWCQKGQQAIVYKLMRDVEFENINENEGAIQENRILGGTRKKYKKETKRRKTNKFIKKNRKTKKFIKKNRKTKKRKGKK